MKIEDQLDDGTEIDQSFPNEIDSTIFKFKYSSGSSPDVSFTSGQVYVTPYFSPGEGGEFVTPKKKVDRNLTKDIEV